MSTAGHGKAPLLAVLLVIAALLVSALGCGATSQDEAQDKSSGKEWSDSEERSSREEEAGEEDDHGSSIPAGRTVHMCGRSVLGGWFEHWGWDYDPANPVRFGSYYLVYQEMDVPPGIVDTAQEAAQETAEGGDEVMFFKLCFADFVGGGEYGARDNLESNMHIVRAVVEAAVEDEGLTLILGNALPMVSEYTDEWLVWNHREYNSFLEELADEYGDRVLILDLYGTLSTSSGSLRPEYAADPSDSHLNDAAYETLDAVLAQILQ